MSWVLLCGTIHVWYITAYLKTKQLSTQCIVIHRSYNPVKFYRNQSRTRDRFKADAARPNAILKPVILEELVTNRRALIQPYLTRDTEPALAQSWAQHLHIGPALTQYWADVSLRPIKFYLGVSGRIPLLARRISMDFSADPVMLWESTPIW